MEFKVELTGDHSHVPVKMTEGAAGLDVFITDTVSLTPGQRQAVSLGFKGEFPSGYVADLRIRSSIGAKFGVVLANQTGVIDSDYRGEVQAVLVNTNYPTVHPLFHPFKYRKQLSSRVTLMQGTRIGQLLFYKIEPVEVVKSNSLSPTDRGLAGFGTTGA